MSWERFESRAGLVHAAWGSVLLASLMLLLLLPPFSGSALARSKEKVSYGEGLIVNVPLPVAAVTQAVQEVAQNGIIRGTKEYNKDQFVSGAVASDASEVFAAWDQGGKVYYKVRMHALDPVNFKDTNDVGTLVVRYVVQPQGDKNTVLRIDALFQEDFRHTLHRSNGSVETSEYKDIREHLDSVELMRQQTLEAVKERDDLRAGKQRGDSAMAGGMSSSRSDGRRVELAEDSNQSPANSPAPGSENEMRSQGVPEPSQPQTGLQGPPQSSPQSSPQSLEEQLKEIRQQVERLVRAPGAPLKSAPFHTASTLLLLNPGTEVLILISTPYWYGVETHDGQHGWMQRDQLEAP